MSMFHELMMRKKEQIMYATIKGTLTENDGVFSGFSASGYLELQQNLDSDNLEMVIDFTTGNSLTAYETIFLNRSIFDLEYYNGYLASYNWQSPSYVQVIPSTDFTANTHYKVKIKRNGNTISFSYSKNGSAFIDTGSFTTTKTATNLPCFGNSSVNTSRYFAGSIDLNNSYIKLGSTKYKLQAVVGYTIVGSPTITDGVVSGFGASDYLETSQSFDVSQTNWEFVIKASKASTGNARVFCINNGNGALNTIFSVVTNILFSCQIRSVTLTINQDFVADTFYYFKIKRNGSMLSLSWSADGVTYQDEQSAEVTDWGNSGYVFYGSVAGLSTAGFGGSIDLNETYIKVNNKLWFNGQQA